MLLTERLKNVKRKTYPALTREFVQSILDYDLETGVFRWRRRAEFPQKWNTRYAGKEAGTVTAAGYVRIQIGKGFHYPAHVLAWLYVHGEYLPGELDHSDGLRSDNRIEKLRRASKSENCCNKNMQRNNKSGFTGVHFVQQCAKWEAVISKGGRRVWRKHFETAEEANAARQTELSRIHGEFAIQEPLRRRYFHPRDRTS